jgi:hypothetical protein
MKLDVVEIELTRIYRKRCCSDRFQIELKCRPVLGSPGQVTFGYSRAAEVRLFIL